MSSVLYPSKFKSRLMSHTNLTPKYEYFAGNVYDIKPPKNQLICLYTNKTNQPPTLRYSQYRTNSLHFINYLKMCISSFIYRVISFSNNVYRWFRR